MLMACPSIDQVVCLLGEVRELHVGLHVFAALLDRVLRRLAQLVGYCKALLDAVLEGRCQFFRQRLHVAVLQSLVGGCDRRRDAARRLEPGEALALARAMDPDQGLKEIPVGDRSGGIGFLSNRQSHVESALDLVFVVRGDPLENRGHVLRIEGALRVRDDRAVHAVAVRESGTGEKAEGCGCHE